MPTNTPKTHPITARDATMYLDDGSGTPVRLRLRALTLALTFGGEQIIHARDEHGDMIGAPRKGPQAGVSTAAVGAKLHQAGDDPSTAYLIDYITRANAYTSLTSTDTSTSDWVIVDFALEIADDGTNKGATYALSKALAQPGASLTKADDGWDLSVTFESPDAAPTITVNP